VRGPAIEFDGVGLTLGNTEILRDVSFKVRAGTIAVRAADARQVLSAHAAQRGDVAVVVAGRRCDNVAVRSERAARADARPAERNATAELLG
jgi:hypothetical protein